MCGAALLAGPGAPLASGAALPDSKGTEFWLAFPLNYDGGGTKTLFLTGDAATTGTVEVPNSAFTQAFTITPGTITTVTLPDSAELKSPGTGASVHVTAAKEVTVYGLNREQYTTDAYLGLPVDVLGTKYTVMSWGAGYGRSEFAVAASQDATTVTITPKTSTADGHPAGVPYDVALNRGQAYQATASSGDLTGSTVVSDKPVAVFGGNECANIPDGGTFYCDHVVEQQSPDVAWGKEFGTVPLKSRIGGDTFRILASEDGTDVKVNGTTVATLNAGESRTQIIDGSSIIASSKPTLVAQFSNGTTFDNVNSDPFMMLVPPLAQFQTAYTVSTPESGFATNEINLIVPASSVGVIKIDGTTVPSSAYTAIGSSGFSGAQVDVGLGSHTATGTGDPFGVFVYGFDSADSYGYAGGLSVAPIARVSSVALTPATETLPVNTQGCVTATVLDQNSGPVAGVRVDFAASGANTASGSQNTDAAGTATYCYTGAAAGTDTVVGSVGLITAQASKTWTAGKKSTSTTSTGDASVQYSDAATLSGTLKDTSVTPAIGIAGKQLDFDLGTQSTSASPTSAGGAASKSLTVTQKPGSVSTVKASFAGDSAYESSSDTKAFSITKEDCTLAYSGDTLVAPATNTTLAADLGEPDASVGDISNKTVTFTVTDAANVSQTFTAVTNAQGHAQTSQPLGANVYGVSVSFAGDEYYKTCTTAADTLVAVQAAGAKVTGGGWISIGTGKTSFGFNAIPQAGGLYKGQFQLRTTSGKTGFHGNVVSTLTSSGSTATWTGSGSWNGATGYTYAISVVDNGASGSKKADTVSITIKDSKNTVVYSTGGAQVLKGGNITVH